MRITVIDGISQSARQILLDAGHVFGAMGQVMWTRLTPIDTAFLHNVIVATPCTGTDHVRACRVLSLRDCGDLSSIRATVEHTLGMILALTRRIPSAVESVRRGEWDRMRFQGMDLRDKNVLIVGYGRIGQAVYNILQYGFHASTYLRDPAISKCMYSLEQTLTDKDIVTVHVSLNDTSRGMFGREQFAVMKRGALFINTSRGAVVDEAALIEALESGHLGGAAIDVLCEEPPRQDNPLLEFARREPQRLLITPHLGGCTVESMEKAEVLLARKLVEVLANGA